jgi:hypothetical protein
MEDEILRLLTNNPGVPFSVKEVGKKIDRQEWQKEPFWAKHILERLVGGKLIEKTPEGFYMAPKKQY